MIIASVTLDIGVKSVKDNVMTAQCRAYVGLIMVIACAFRVLEVPHALNVCVHSTVMVMENVMGIPNVSVIRIGRVSIVVFGQFLNPQCLLLP
jgi:hypothetical protein